MIHPFELHRPATVPDAIGLLGTLPEAAAYRGGTEILQVMKLGLARFRHLVDLKAIPALHGIETRPDGSIAIAAGTTHQDIERSTVIRDAWPALASLERHVANRRVRSVGSIGGNLCFAEPHSDPAALLLAAGATLELESGEGRRRLGVDEFILDPFVTDLGPGELLTAVVLPPIGDDTGIAYRRLALAERPTVSVACALVARDGVVTAARIAVGSVGDRPALGPQAGAGLLGAAVGDFDEAARAAAAVVADTCAAVDETGISADYRRHLAGVLARRAIVAAREAIHG